MKFLFVHSRFPGPFRHLAPDLARNGTHRVAALHMRSDLPDRAGGVALFGCVAQRGSCPDVHPWLQPLEARTIRGETVFRAALGLRAGGFDPDVIIGHPSGGEMLFIRDVWPQARIALSCDYYLRSDGRDVNFDPEFAEGDPLPQGRPLFQNLHLDLSLRGMDAGYAPTAFQARSFPPQIAERLGILPHGVDTQRFSPDPAATVALDEETSLDATSTVITFEAPVLDPASGLHRLIRAAPAMLAACPTAHLVVIGRDVAAPDGTSWRERFAGKAWADMRPQDRRRVHFIGQPDAQGRLHILQRTTLYLHLSYPLPLPQAVLEAMSVGACVVAADGDPVREVVTDGETGRLVDFFDTDGLVDCIATLLASPALRERLGAAARSLVQQRFDLRRVALPRARQWVEALARF